MIKLQKHVVVSFCLLALIGTILPYTSLASSTQVSLHPNNSWPSTNGGVTAIVVASDGSVYIGGSFTSVDGDTRNHLAKLDADGVLTAWDPDISQSVTSMLLSPDESILYVGTRFAFNANQSTTPVARNRLAAFSTTTGVATAFNPDINNEASTLAISSNGATLYVGGSFTSVNQSTTPLTRNRIAAFNTTTSVGTSFNPNVNSTVRSIVLSGDGSTLYAGGGFSTVNQGGTPLTGNYIGAFNTTKSVATAFDPDLDATVNDIKLDGTTLYAVGDFSTVNQGGTPLTRNFGAAFNTTTSIATAFDPDSDVEMSTIALDTTNDIAYLGGSLQSLNVNYNETDRGRSGAVDMNDGSVLSWNPDFNSGVSTLVLSSDGLYVGGLFTTENGGSYTKQYFARFNSPDAVSPVLTEVTPVTTPTSNSAPSYTLNLSEESTLSFSGDCSAGDYEDTFSAGNLTITFDSLADGTYSNCEIYGTDEFGNESDPLLITEFVIDTTEPVVSLVASSASSTSATITWTTNEASSSVVSYGTTIDYGTDTAEADTSPRVTSHSVSLSGLTVCTTYHYLVYSVDTAGNEVYGVDNTFTTTGCSSGGGGVVSLSFLIAQNQQNQIQNIQTNTNIPTPPTFIFTKNLKFNSKDNEVKELQKYLNSHGFKVSDFGAGSKEKETTIFGIKTKNALLKFQIANQLQADGIVGPKTRAYINSHQ